MATELIPVGNTAANSAEFTLADGATTTVALMGVTDARARVDIKYKASNGDFVLLGSLLPGGNKDALCIASPGTYRLNRIAGYACGVSRD